MVTSKVKHTRSRSESESEQGVAPSLIHYDTFSNTIFMKILQLGLRSDTGITNKTRCERFMKSVLCEA